MDASLATGGAVVSPGTTSLASVALSLLLVLGLIVALGWLVARLRGIGPGAGGNGPLRVAATASLGIKERLVLVDAAGAWLLLGVTPGKVRVLHRYAQRPEGITEGAATPAFASLLARLKKPGATP